MNSEELEISQQQKPVDKNKNRTLIPQIIQSLVYDIVFIIVGILLFTETLEFSETQETLITFVMGMLSSGLIQVNNFWFGSSSGSKDKTLMMSGSQSTK